MNRLPALKFPQIIGVTCLLFSVGLSGCAGLSQQMRATYSGIKIEYKTPIETLPVPKSPVQIVVKDERLDREVLGPGAKSSFGSRALGFFAFGIASLAIPGEPSFQETDLEGIFRKAFSERLKTSNIPIAAESAGDQIVLEVLIRHFNLNFNWGKWLGKAGYVLRVRKGATLLCEESISEQVTRGNMWGYGSGECALSEVFVKAVNRANLASCFSNTKD